MSAFKILFSRSPSLALPNTPVAASRAPQRTVGPFPAFDQEQGAQASFDLGQYWRLGSGAINCSEGGKLERREDNCIGHLDSLVRGEARRLSKIDRFARSARNLLLLNDDGIIGRRA